LLPGAGPARGCRRLKWVNDGRVGEKRKRQTQNIGSKGGGGHPWLNPPKKKKQKGKNG